MNKKETLLSALTMINLIILVFVLNWLLTDPLPEKDDNLLIQGHLGIAGTPPDPNRTLSICEIITDPIGGKSYRIAGSFMPYVSATTEPCNKTIIGAVGEVVLDANNTQDWIRTMPLRGIQGQITALPGAEGIVTRGVSVVAIVDWRGGNLRDWRGVYILPYLTSPGEIQDCYGIYIENIDKGANLNYAIYSVGGNVYLGGGVILNSALDMPNIPTSDPYVAGRVWSNDGVLTISGGL